MRATLEALSKDEKNQQECARILAFIGHSSSGPTQKINNILSPFGIPQVNNLLICLNYTEMLRFS